MKHIGAKVLGFFCLALLVGVVAAGSAAAAAPEAEEGPSASNEGTSTAVEAVPLSPLSLGQCTQGTICIWGANNWEGNFSWWGGQNTGCQNHPGNPEIRSLWNRTGFTAELQGYGQIPSGERFTNKGVFTGYLCW